MIATNFTSYGLSIPRQRSERVMEIEINPIPDNFEIPPEVNKLIQELISNDKIIFKSQQRDEADLNLIEKSKIAYEIFNKSKYTFINRFGKYLSMESLNYLRQFEGNDEEGLEISLLLRSLIEHSRHIRVDCKNRRYVALTKLIEGNSYFSETEMMKRNPLLYQQLVGQYLSEGEMKERDRFSKDVTFVHLLMEGMERDRADNKRKIQQENEDNAMEEEDSDDDDVTDVARNRIESRPSTSKWGEFTENEDCPIRRYAVYTQPQKFITKEERELLRNEFVTLMYRSFLDGKDEEFDYDTVDNNDSYDNIDIIDHDKEDEYFDDEEPENVADMNVDQQNIVESSEDELDIYMNALNQHPTVCQLSQELKKL